MREPKDTLFRCPENLCISSSIRYRLLYRISWEFTKFSLTPVVFIAFLKSLECSERTFLLTKLWGRLSWLHQMKNHSQIEMLIWLEPFSCVCEYAALCLFFHRPSVDSIRIYAQINVPFQWDVTSNIYRRKDYINATERDRESEQCSIIENIYATSSPITSGLPDFTTKLHNPQSNLSMFFSIAKQFEDISAKLKPVWQFNEN